MKEYFYLLVLTITYCNCYYLIKKRIVEGRPADVTEVPYIAQIIDCGELECGASIISNGWLLTAAHCVDDNPEANNLEIVTGATNVKNDGIRHEVEYLIIHDNFDAITLDNDIALIKLKKPMRFSRTTKAIRLSKRVPRTGDRLKISGYGRISEDGPLSPVLKTAEISVVNIRVCQKQYKLTDELTDNMFCAGGCGTDTCQGDSGGPAVSKGELIGVISSGKGCGTHTHAGIFIKVANYLDWIEEHTGISHGSAEYTKKLSKCLRVY